MRPRGGTNVAVGHKAQVGVVRATPVQPLSRPRLRAQAGPELTSDHRTRQRGFVVKKRGILGKLGPTASSPPQPIRIKTWTPRESFTLPGTEKERLEAAVEEAVRVVSSLLSVNRTVGPLLLSRDINKYCKFLWKNSNTVNYNRCGRANRNYRTETCLDVTIPDDHLSGCDIYPEADSPHRTVLRPEGAGLPDTDFLLYISVHATDKCRAEPRVLAYAVHCQTDPWGRPVAGVVVLCRDRLTGDTYSHQTTVQTVIHELFHALGFSKDLFSTWRDCSSSYQGGALCPPRGKAIHSDGSGQVRIYTPSIISALQRHLASTDPELGGPLENLDGSSHWESRVLQGSIMTAVLGEPTTVRIDPVTLAALQDTGWYRVHQSRAQSLVWGDGEGATFGSLSTCKDNSSSFFCSGSGVGCHFLHLHKGECQTDPYLEGCQIYKPIQNGSECWKKENLRWPAEESGEIFGFDSRCFFSSLFRQVSFVQLSSSVEGRCYRHRCTGPNRYQIQVSDSGWVDCPAGGAIQIKIKGYQGSVFCPDRRLCLYPDVTPPLEDNNPLPACDSCDPPRTVSSARDGTWSPLRSHLTAGVAASLCVTAAATFMAALLLSYRKCQTSLNRVHTVAPEDHMQL
ncbi:leishmanolysin-like peptidase 2 isoform X2 [Kryptolebias marmoratus]|uniref:leishmanolysin-like peptidase 2 isoform X2 n=1 Tax=Kryptolebias marmoratus TaxID=37003 RepID=UPI0018ACCFD9|nr:leishmanolysin-like peptidase 2 isoform X2 [Kryptolebias marmoratus]